MEVIIAPDACTSVGIAADMVIRLIKSVPRPVLGLATGNSPLPLYRELIDRHRAGIVSFSECRAFLVDEYVGLGAGHPRSFRSFISREFLSQTDFDSRSLFGPDGNSNDPVEEARRFEENIADVGGVDIQVLGVGADGHIGFNEPASSLASRTRLKTLTRSTRVDNARFFDYRHEQVPQHVITQGIGTILEARQLLLLANGPAKADAVSRLVEGPLTAMMPASALQLHPKATVIIDVAASLSLAQADYYRYVYENKPDRQVIGRPQLGTVPD